MTVKKKQEAGWVVRNVSREAKDKARAEAKKRKMYLGEWLNYNILHNSTTGQEPSLSAKEVADLISELRAERAKTLWSRIRGN